MLYVDPFPSVLKQGYDVEMLPGPIGGYNSGLLEIGGALMLCSRVWEFSPMLKSKLVWQRVLDKPDANGLRLEPVGECVIVGLGATSNAEDARLVRGPDGTIWVIFTEAVYDAPPWKVILRVARIRPGASIFEAELMPIIQFGGNGKTSEKNWQMFFVGERMFFSYWCHPHKTFEVNPNTFEVIGSWNSEQSYIWQYGTMSGGTPPVYWRDKLVTFYHGNMPHPKKRRRYFMGAMAFELEPPFKTLWITPPMLRGSLQDPQSYDPPNHPGLPIVVFPAGCIFKENSANEVIVSMGINDSYDALGRFDLRSLPWQVVETLKVPRIFYFFTEDTSSPPRANQARFLEWRPVDGGGVLATENPVAIDDCHTRGSNTREITQEEYEKRIQ